MLTNLVERFKAFRGGPNKIAQRDTVDSALNRVYLALHQMQRDRHFIEVCVDGDDRIYQSILLSLDPEHRTILIDGLFPEGFIGLAGQHVHISIRQKAGRKVKFQSVILERHNYNDTPLYVIEMPTSLDLDQRRSAYRLPIHSKTTIESNFVAPDSQAYKGRLRNLSSTGLCMEVEGENIEQIHCDDHLTDVIFDFAGINMDCELTVRTINDGKNCWVIGAEFVDLPVQEQRLLEKSIMRIQRDRIKYAGDMQLQQAIA